MFDLCLLGVAQFHTVPFESQLRLQLETPRAPHLVVIIKIVVFETRVVVHLRGVAYDKLNRRWFVDVDGWFVDVCIDISN